MSALKGNKTLQRLNLFNNIVAYDGALAIGEMLKCNSSLFGLNLCSCSFKTRGVVILAMKGYARMSGLFYIKSADLLQHKAIDVPREIYELLVILQEFIDKLKSTFAI